MESLTNFMCVKNGRITLSKYEIIEAFFRTEDEENANMATELNKLINAFYEQERQTRRNVTELQFDVSANRNAIDYIRKSAIC